MVYSFVSNFLLKPSDIPMHPVLLNVLLGFDWLYRLAARS